MRQVFHWVRRIAQQSVLPRIASACLLCGALAAPVAQAEEAGFYVGAQIYGVRHSSPGGTDFSGGVTLGYRFNDYLGIEMSAKKTHVDSALSADEDHGVRGGELALRLRHDLSDWLGVTAKVGAYDWRDANRATLGSRRGTDAVVGAGLTFRVSEQISLSTEYEKILGFGADREDSNASVGLRYDFN
ncbi:MAG: porin family protein [Tahibacter sp.]